MEKGQVLMVHGLVGYVVSSFEEDGMREGSCGREGMQSMGRTSGRVPDALGRRRVLAAVRDSCGVVRGNCRGVRWGFLSSNNKAFKPFSPSSFVLRYSLEYLMH